MNRTHRLVDSVACAFHGLVLLLSLGVLAGGAWVCVVFARYSLAMGLPDACTAMLAALAVACVVLVWLLLVELGRAWRKPHE